MADYKQLCAELVNELHGYKVAHPNHDTDLINRARAELAKPEPERPTDEELSPAAQAVLDAFIGENTIYGLHLMTPKLAAALRAAAVYLYCTVDRQRLAAIAQSLKPRPKRN